MTPAEIAALRERLTYLADTYAFSVAQSDCVPVPERLVRAALVLLDAQAETIKRLTAERERVRADGIEEAARWHDALAAEHEDNARYWGGPDHMGNAQKAREHREYAAGIRALLAPAPAAEVAG